MWKSLIIFTAVAGYVSTTCVKDSCPPNEVYDICPAPCPPRRCDVDERVIRCAAPPKPGDPNCKPGCRCADGYYRNSKGVCVTRDQCDSCPRPNEVYDICPAPCPPQRCGVDIALILCAPSPKPGDPECQPGCRCIDGYVRNDENACIPKDQCPPVCNTNEVYDGCANGGCRKRSCSEEVTCVYPYVCQGGCVCQENYTRTDNGTCIPEDQCELQCNKPNEYLENCPKTCPPQTCDSIGKTYHCPIQATVCKEPACRCKKGYYRNINGDCITEEECKQCTGPHEYFACGGACDNVCATINKQNQTNCPIINIKCNPKCYCEKDYARDENGICIPISQCPAPQCADNEIFEQCPENSCVPLTCSQLGFPINCTTSSDDCNTSCGKPRCICDNGNVRDDNGNCIPREQCPSCGGDRNATSGCGNNCNKRCSNYKEKHVACTLSCLLNGCDCKDGYVYDDNKKICVLPEDCTPVCSVNEVYDQCANGGCSRKKCSELVNPVICTNPINCIGDCVCKDGYLRNDKGKCVPENKCKPNCGLNEVYNPCSYGCPPNTCQSLGRAYACPIRESDICQGRCVCKPGYYRNSIGLCITEEQCLKCKGPNEFFACGGACDNVCATLHKQSKNNCPIRNIKCNPMCYCEDGFARDANNICIPIEQCPGSSNSTNPIPATQPCSQPSTQPSSQPSPTVNVTEAKAKLDQGCIALSHEFIYQMYQSNPDDNFVVSAASVLIPLAQLALFAVGSVFSAIMKVLNVHSKDEIKSVYLLETPNYANQQNVEFELATKYYANKNYPLSDAFISDSKIYFNASGENIDFSNPEAAADTINAWVEERTHDRIKDLISPDMLNANTVAVLVNAIYFLGNWVHQFNPDNTEKRDFTKRNGDVIQLDTMYQENRFSYGEVNNLNLQCLEMSYKNFNFSMFIILPQAGYFDDTIKTLRNDREAFNRIRDSMRFEKVQVYLPKMEINTNVPLGDLLEKAGLSSLFDPSSDGFKGILANDRLLYISSAIQKAFMKSDEKGTEAAAATGITVSTTSVVLEPPKIYEFKVNRPALMYILFQGVPYFCGVFAGAS